MCLTPEQAIMLLTGTVLFSTVLIVFGFIADFIARGDRPGP